MTVAFDSVGAGRANASHVAGTAVTETHTVVSSNPVQVLLCLGYEQGSAIGFPTLSPVTFGGTSMILVGNLGNNNLASTNGWIGIYKLLWTGGAGAQTVSVTDTTSTTSWWYNTVAYTGVGSVSAPVTNGGSSTSPSVTVTSATGHMVVSIMGIFDKAVSAPTQTSRYSQSGTSLIESGIIQDAAGASSVTFGMTVGGTAAWAALAVDLAPPSPIPTDLFFPFLT